jgi:pimeloyl-ACP methyl ester carboxylesterase
MSVRVPIIVIVAVALAIAGLAAFTAYDAKRISEAHRPKGQFVEVEGGRIHLVELGPKNTNSIVLLHGASVKLGDVELALGQRLSAMNRVVAVDRPGHGWSDRPGRAEDASPTLQARLINQALSRIGVVQPVLVTHSWAGALAVAYALEYPNDIAGLVLLAPVVFPWSTHTTAWHNRFVQVALLQATSLGAGPITGPFFAYTVALPFSKVLMAASIESAFAPHIVPDAARLFHTSDSVAFADLTIDTRPDPAARRMVRRAVRRQLADPDLHRVGADAPACDRGSVGRRRR